MHYAIRRAPQALGHPTADIERPLWREAEAAAITHYERDDSGHRPPTSARLLYDDDFLTVAFCVKDPH